MTETHFDTRKISDTEERQEHALATSFRVVVVEQGLMGSAIRPGLVVTEHCGQRTD